MTFAIFVETSSLEKLTARTTTVSHFAAGEALAVDVQFGGESTSSNANELPLVAFAWVAANNVVSPKLIN